MLQHVSQAGRDPRGSVRQSNLPAARKAPGQGRGRAHGQTIAARKAADARLGLSVRYLHRNPVTRSTTRLDSASRGVSGFLMSDLAMLTMIRPKAAASTSLRSSTSSIIPLDGRASLDANIRTWFGDSRGRWEGDTLVVEVTNFSDQTNYRGAGAVLELTERYSQVDEETVRVDITVNDPSTWTWPWTAVIEGKRDPSYWQIFDCACPRGELQHDLHAGGCARGRPGRVSRRALMLVQVSAVGWLLLGALSGVLVIGFARRLQWRNQVRLFALYLFLAGAIYQAFGAFHGLPWVAVEGAGFLLFSLLAWGGSAAAVVAGARLVAARGLGRRGCTSRLSSP